MWGGNTPCCAAYVPFFNLCAILSHAIARYARDQRQPLCLTQAHGCHYVCGRSSRSALPRCCPTFDSYSSTAVVFTFTSQHAGKSFGRQLRSAQQSSIRPAKQTASALAGLQQAHLVRIVAAQRQRHQPPRTCCSPLSRCCCRSHAGHCRNVHIHHLPCIRCPQLVEHRPTSQ